jgi:hypothetical protein
MGRNLSTLFISQSYQFLTQISGSELQDGLGNTITGSLAITSSQAISSSFAITASFALNGGGGTVSTASLLTTASAANNVITFTKGDSSQFTVTVATGSAATVNTGSLLVTASISNATTTFTKGDGSTFSITANNVVNANTASYVLNAVSASFATSATTATSASFASFAISSSNSATSISSSYSLISTSSSFATSAQTATSASFATNAATATSSSFATNANTATSASFATFAATATSASFATSAASATSASFATTAATASFYNEADTLQTVTTRGNSTSTNISASGFYTTGTITTQNAIVLGTASIAFLDVTYQSSSVIYSSGSNQFGDASNDIQTLFGTVDVKTGPLKVTGSISITGSDLTIANGSKIVAHDINAGGVNGIEINNNGGNPVALFGAGGSQGTTFYGQINGTTFVGTASLATTASYALNATSASFAPAGNPFPFNGSAQINGSLGVTGSAIIGAVGNSATGLNSVVLGGATNSVDSPYSATVGGSVNTVNGARSVIIGGESNSTSNTSIGGIYSGNGNSIFGGNDNVLVTVGGVSNVINSNGGIGVTIVGGQSNAIRNFASTGLSRDSHCAIVGGKSNRIDDGANSGTGGSNGQSIILGGIGNNIKGLYTLSTDNFSVGILTSSGSVITATSRSAIIGGQNNLISGSNNSVILGGSNITASVSNTVFVPNFNVSGSSTFKQSTVFSGSVRGEVQALSIASNTASLDCSTDNFYTLTLVSGSNTFINPSNIAAGQTINLRVTQANPGNGTVSFPTSVKQVSGSSYVPSTGAGPQDIVTFISFDASSLYLSNVKNLV